MKRKKSGETFSIRVTKPKKKFSKQIVSELKMQVLVIEVTNFKMHRPTAVFKLWVSVKVYRENEEGKNFVVLASVLRAINFFLQFFLRSGKDEK
jgi:hypothetical protein